jgi:predicted TIM-barrel fold metal-dependent hydrolase
MSTTVRRDFKTLLSYSIEKIRQEFTKIQNTSIIINHLGTMSIQRTRTESNFSDLV